MKYVKRVLSGILLLGGKEAFSQFGAWVDGQVSTEICYWLQPRGEMSITSSRIRSNDAKQPHYFEIQSIWMEGAYGGLLNLKLDRLVVLQTEVSHFTGLSAIVEVTNDMQIMAME